MDKGLTGAPNASNFLGLAMVVMPCKRLNGRCPIQAKDAGWQVSESRLAAFACGVLAHTNKTVGVL